MMTPFSAAVMFTVVFATGMLVFSWKKINDRLLKLSISFTGSFLFTISMVQLLPEVFSRGASHVGYFILAGFFLQLVLEYFSEGIEHGHQHHHHHP